MRAIIFILFLLVSGSIQAQKNSERIQGRLIIQLDSKIKLTQWLTTFEKYRSSFVSLEFSKTIFQDLNIHLFEFDEEKAPYSEIIKSLEQLSGVLSVSGDHKVEMRNSPNDPSFPSQWPLELIKATDVWNFTEGGRTTQNDEIVIAVVDDGFRPLEEDLLENIWVNADEIPNDGIDNDSNGYIDDYYGLNVRTGKDDHASLTHGTSVCGILGAKGNNGVGIAGVNWNIKIMLISGIRFESEIIEAYQYALKERQDYNNSSGNDGSYVVATNSSFGINGEFAEDFVAWCQAYDALGTAGIINVCSTSNQEVDVELEGDMPSTCTSPYLIVVTNTDQQDILAGGFGNVSVDLSAPGDGSISIFGEFGGTSASCPHVTGGIGLLYSLPCDEFVSLSKSNPGSAALAIKEAILEGVDSVTGLNGVTTTGGRLNLFNSMLNIGNYCEASSGDLAILEMYPNPVDGNYIRFVYETPNFEPYQLVVYNSLGQIMINSQIIPPLFSSKFLLINTKDLYSGIYYVCLYGAKEKVCSSFFVL